MSTENKARKLEQEWALGPRWRSIKFGCSAADVVSLRGTMPIEYALAKRGAEKLEKLWKLIHSEDFVNTSALVTPGKGILAIDESLPSIKKRFDSIGGYGRIGCNIGGYGRIDIVGKLLGEELLEEELLTFSKNQLVQVRQREQCTKKNHIADLLLMSLCRRLLVVYQCRHTQQYQCARHCRSPPKERTFLLFHSPPSPFIEGQIMVEITKNIGTRIKILRTTRGISQKSLAVKSGISVNYLCQIEAGRKKPSLTLLTELASNLGVTTPALLEPDPVVEQLRTIVDINGLEAVLKGLEKLIRMAENEASLSEFHK